ncbi:Murein DD-endopeptidase MepM [Kordia antarctica]|uniref:Murein DD-endopeptidase MepM n=1 Tax=Kordia antarctica TaxID=1218801 RepID=A0A7L4ZKQ4_9FLAO|nr:M23 family metallopeptidase [Kordia antarctica]QHI37100.1 Murein DD-endopeptidase MepM [Kordia antarctica]
MKSILFISILLFSGICISQSPIESTSKSMVGKVKIFGVNNTSLTYSVEFKLKGTGCKPSKPLPLTIVMPPKANIELFDLFPVENKKWKCTTNYTYVVGNINAKHNDDYVYDLPYAKGSSFIVHQGYNGSFSHKGQYFLDFTMPVNTPIHAIRDGVVIKVKKDSKKGCPTISCVNDGNYVWIEHDDGTIAEYAHLRYRGTALKLGNRVKKGQKIAFSGNTGFSQAPHLHMGVFINQINGERTTIPIKFNVGNEKVVELKKGDTYVKQ